MKQTWTHAEKVALVEAYLNQGLRLELVAQALGLATSTIRSWIRSYQAGQLGVAPRIFLTVPLDDAWLGPLDVQRGDVSVSFWVHRLIARELGHAVESEPECDIFPALELQLARLPRDQKRRRWTPELRTALVAAILTGRIERDWACREHGLTEAELSLWIDRHRELTRRQCQLILEPGTISQIKRRCWRVPHKRLPEQIVEWIQALIRSELMAEEERPPRKASRDFRPYGGRKQSGESE